MKENIATGSRILLLLNLLLILGCFSTQGQQVERQFEKAKLLLGQGNYPEAEKLASGILRKDTAFIPAYLLLADIYNETDSVQKEAEILKAMVRRTGQQTPLLQLRLGKACYLSGDYQNAMAWFEKYLEDKASPGGRKEEVQRLLTNCMFAIESMQSPVQFNPVRLGDEINTENDEYWPSITIDGSRLVFTRLLKPFGGAGLPQEDFYISEAGPGGWSESKPIIEINTGGNEGAQSISADGRWLFFTACNRPDGQGSCDIYFSFYSAGKWSQPKPLREPINTMGWEGQPSISANGDYLYFSSTRPGGKGGRDLWRCHFEDIRADGMPLWGNPENLGDSVNTPGNEISPFIHPNGTDLYFSSDYRTGMGGFDLFLSRLKGDNCWSQPRNMGYPVNTYKNEQGLVIDATGETAFFSSGREKGTGMDIYSFELDQKFRPNPVSWITAQVIDSRTGNPVQADVRLENLKNHETEAMATDPGGLLFMSLPAGSDYAFIVSKAGYLFYSENFSLSDPGSPLEPHHLMIRLNPVEIGQKMDLYNIFFETDSSVIKDESFAELEKLRKFLTENPDLEVEIQGHTDNTGSREYNMELSERRAKSVLNYLTSNGIGGGRLYSKGYGAERPVASNETEEGKRQNRRTTILVMGKK